MPSPSPPQIANILRRRRAHRLGIHATNVLKSKYTGKGVRFTILDTGIHAEHPDFEGRKIRAVSFVGKSTNDLNANGHVQGDFYVTRIGREEWGNIVKAMRP